MDMVESTVTNGGSSEVRQSRYLRMRAFRVVAGGIVAVLVNVETSIKG